MMSSTDGKGEVIAGRFEVLSLLGAGLLGTVYRARDLTDPTDTDGGVALKLLRLNENPQAIRTEAMTLIALRQTEADLADGLHAAPTLLMAETNGSQPFIAVEYMRGRRVIDLLRDREPRGLDEPEALNIISQLLRVLDLLHRKLNKTYIDLKLENLWWQPNPTAIGDGELKITGWDVLEDRKLLAPYQLDSAVMRDLFRASLYLYRLLTGGLPELRGDLYVGRLDRLPTWPQVTSGTRTAVAKALDSRLEARFETAVAMRLRVEQLLGYWQRGSANLDELIREANSALQESDERDEASERQHLYTVAQSMADVARRLIGTRVDDGLDYLESQLKEGDEVARSQALFVAGSYRAARELIEKALGQRSDASALKWWLGMLRLLETSGGDNDRRTRAAATGEAYRVGDYREAWRAYRDFRATFQNPDPTIAAPLNILESAIEIQKMVAEAEEQREQHHYSEAVKKYEAARDQWQRELAEVLPDEYEADLKAEWVSAQHLAQTVEVAQAKLKEGQAHFAQGSLLQAGQAWADGLAAHPGNGELLDAVIQLAGTLSEQEKWAALLDLTEHITALAQPQTQLRDYRIQAAAKLDEYRNNLLKQTIQRTVEAHLRTKLRAESEDGQWLDVFGLVKRLCLSVEPQVVSETIQILSQYLQQTLHARTPNELEALRKWIGDQTGTTAHLLKPVLYAVETEVNHRAAQQKADEEQRAREASLGLEDALLLRLREGDHEAALALGEKWVAQIQTSPTLNMAVVLEARAKVKALSEAKDLILWRQYLRVFGQLVDQKFIIDLILNSLNLPVQAWDEAAPELVRLIEHLWPTEAERSQLYNALQQVREARDQERQKLNQERILLIRDRLMRLDDAFNDNRARNEITLEGARIQLGDIADLLSQTSPTDPNATIPRQRQAERLRLLDEANHLFERAKASPDPDEKRNLVAELKKRHFAGRQVKGDFEKELGIQEAPAVKRHDQTLAHGVSPITQPSVARVDPMAQTTMIDTKELRARVASVSATQPAIKPMGEPSQPSDPEIERAIERALQTTNPYEVMLEFKTLKKLLLEHPKYPRLEHKLEEVRKRLERPYPTDEEKQNLTLIKHLQLVRPRQCLWDWLPEAHIRRYHPEIQVELESIRGRLVLMSQYEPALLEALDDIYARSVSRKMYEANLRAVAKRFSKSWSENHFADYLNAFDIEKGKKKLEQTQADQPAPTSPKPALAEAPAPPSVPRLPATSVPNTPANREARSKPMNGLVLFVIISLGGAGLSWAMGMVGQGPLAALMATSTPTFTLTSMVTGTSTFTDTATQTATASPTQTATRTTIPTRTATKTSTATFTATQTATKRPVTPRPPASTATPASIAGSLRTSLGSLLGEINTLASGLNTGSVICANFVQRYEVVAQLPTYNADLEPPNVKEANQKYEGARQQALGPAKELYNWCKTPSGSIPYSVWNPALQGLNNAYLFAQDGLKLLQ